MAYNNGFPVGYQPAQIYYPQQYQVIPQNQISTPQSSQIQQSQPMNSSIIWVQGEAGAKSYMVAPNNTVQLWDSENQVIYLKSADASGMPSMKILDYKIREATPTVQQPQVINTQNQDYVTREELSEFEDQIRKQIANLKKENKEDGESVI